MEKFFELNNPQLGRRVEVLNALIASILHAHLFVKPEVIAQIQRGVNAISENAYLFGRRDQSVNKPFFDDQEKENKNATTH